MTRKGKRYLCASLALLAAGGLLWTAIRMRKPTASPETPSSETSAAGASDRTPTEPAASSVPATAAPETVSPPAREPEETKSEEGAGTGEETKKAPGTTAAPPPVVTRAPEVSVQTEKEIDPVPQGPENPFENGSDSVIRERKAEDYVPQKEPGPGEGHSF